MCPLKPSLDIRVSVIEINLLIRDLVKKRIAAKSKYNLGSILQCFRGEKCGVKLTRLSLNRF